MYLRAMELHLFEQSWLDVWQGREPHEPIGAIFTKPEVTSLILDLAGYRGETARLAEHRLLEPSCGDGAFLSEAIRRLLHSERHHRGIIDWEDDALATALTACDINSGFVAVAREQVRKLLVADGCPSARALVLASKWIQHGDFLLTHWPEAFDFVIGNPPYVRIEDLPPAVLQRYRELYRTCADRADLYVAFFEQGLGLLSARGCLAFICANRFAKNLYGRGLRRMIAEEFHVRFYINLEHTQPFASDVSAYPCVTVIDRQKGEPTHATSLQNVDFSTLKELSAESGRPSPKKMAVFSSWYADGAPWTSTDRGGHDRLNALAMRCPLLEDSAETTKIGIGVATGADRIFVRRGLDPAIEAECQLPLLMAADIQPGELTWSEHYLINPFSDRDDGTLRDSSSHPLLAAYFELHREALSRRHVVQKRAESWYRTIDRVALALVRTPKLVIPDIQAGGVVGYDAGYYYPHHNVYWITSNGWNLQTLQALLRSSIVLEQIRAFSVQMRGGSVRYQAQVLRKVRVPAVSSLPMELQERLAKMAGSDDREKIDELAREAYRL